MPLSAMTNSQARGVGQPGRDSDHDEVHAENGVGGPWHPTALCPSGDRSPCSPAYEVPCDDVGVKMDSTIKLMLAGFEKLARLQLEPQAQQHLPALMCLMRQFHGLLGDRQISNAALTDKYSEIMKELDKFPGKDVLGVRVFLTRKYDHRVRQKSSH